MKKRAIVILAILVILIVTIASYKVIAGNEMKKRTYEFLQTKGYGVEDVLKVEIKHSFINKLLSYNEWRIFVTFKSNPDIVFAFTYRNNEIVRQGVSSTHLLDKDEILDYENQFENGSFRDI